MQETYQHDQKTQRIDTTPPQAGSRDARFQAFDADGSYHGEFLTHGAASFVLGCLRQVRESQITRAGYRTVAA